MKLLRRKHKHNSTVEHESTRLAVYQGKQHTCSIEFGGFTLTEISPYHARSIAARLVDCANRHAPKKRTLGIMTAPADTAKKLYWTDGADVFQSELDAEREESGIPKWGIFFCTALEWNTSAIRELYDAPTI